MADHPEGGAGEAAPPREEISRFVQIARGKVEWEQTVDAIDDPIALQDGFTVRRANRALAQAGGVPVQTLPGRSCHALLAGRETPCEGCPLLAAPGKPEQARGEIVTGDGRRFEVSAFPLVGSANGWVVRHRDVTLERATLAALQEQERMAAVGRLAAGAAHEINNPLSFLISNLTSLGRDIERLDALARSLRRVLDLAQAGGREAALDALARFQGSPHLSALRGLGEDGPERIADALVGAQRVANIVRALRSLATERLGESCEVDAADSVDRALRRIGEEGPKLERHPVDWRDRRPLPVLGQPQSLDEALYQILKNAFHFSPPGAPVRISSTIDGATAWVEIEDLGPGAPAELANRVFEPFFTTLPPGEGLGLGLTVAYGIVRQHSGHIRFESEPGKGTSVRIGLPLRRAERPLDVDEGDGAVAQARDPRSVDPHDGAAATAGSLSSVDHAAELAQ
ncbi:MAG: PAS domain-containing sensor histidine kinase [Myxococcales bacterium]